MKKNLILLALALMPVLSIAQSATDVSSTAKAGAVTEAMQDSVGEKPADTVEGEKPLKRRSTVLFTSSIVIVIVAVAAARRRRRNMGR